MQRGQHLVLDEGRGHFYDRRGLPLTGEVTYALAVFPVHEGGRGNQQAMQELYNILGISADEWNLFENIVREPRLFGPNSAAPLRLSWAQAKKIEGLQLQGIRPVPYVSRYFSAGTAEHLLGFIGQNPERLKQLYPEQLRRGQMRSASVTGAAGLEKTFDRYLQSRGKTTLSFFTDGKNDPLSGLEYRFTDTLSPFYPVKIITTLDKPVQQEIEQVLERNSVAQGAVVVLDASNADVIAMASRPRFDPAHVEPGEGNWRNLAVKAEPPGSIFKTVVAAAALEKGAVRPGELFECRGSLGKYGFSCWKKDGHGHISFAEAYAVSCNITFAEVVRRISSAELEEWANRLGVTAPVGWRGKDRFQGTFRQFDGEEPGQVFSAATAEHDDGVRVQTGIGQRDVLMTPLQAANLAVTLLNGGEVKMPRVVKEIRYADNSLMSSFAEQSLSKEKVMSRQTAQTLLHFMERVVEQGTAAGLQQARWKLAGKSGTAQVNGGKAQNEWFIGYGPVEQPRFAAAVLVRTAGEDGRHLATEVFKQVMNVLAEHSL
jgi:cell division protein FtsI/penicillin-binding protein 2